MSADKIEITYVEFDTDKAFKIAVGALYYCEWKRNGVIEWAHSDPERASSTPEDGERDGIPDDVRVALALLVAPGLVEAVTKAPEPPVKPVPDTRGQDTISDSKSMREGKPR